MLPLVQKMGCRLLGGAKPLSKPMLKNCQLNPREQISVKLWIKMKQFSYKKMPAILPRSHCINIVNTVMSGQNSRHFADDSFLDEELCILIQILQKFVCCGPIDDEPPLLRLKPEPLMNMFKDPKWPHQGAKSCFPNYEAALPRHKRRGTRNNDLESISSD